ncbi:MAG: CDGSH iron-sulfur domain-containing protein [Gammaproteobacteria bacterium]
MLTGNTIKVRVNGPLLCKGEIEILDSDGKLLEKTHDVALCRCGASKNKPYCDGSHKDADFTDDGNFTDQRSEMLEGEGILQITLRENAMLLGKGPVTIVSADGSCQTTRNKVALCRSGCSNNKPFCDASHKECGFRS